MKVSNIIMLDLGPVRSLYEAGQMTLLLEYQLEIVIVDALYDEIEDQPPAVPDTDIRNFINGHLPPFVIAKTEAGTDERLKLMQGSGRDKGAANRAVIEFLSSEGALNRYFRDDQDVILLHEQRDWCFVHAPTHIRIMSTFDLLQDLEFNGIITRAENVIQEMRPDGMVVNEDGLRSCEMTHLQPSIGHDPSDGAHKIMAN